MALAPPPEEETEGQKLSQCVVSLAGRLQSYSRSPGKTCPRPWALEPYTVPQTSILGHLLFPVLPEGLRGAHTLENRACRKSDRLELESYHRL